MTRRLDAAEALANSLAGLPVSWAATYWLLPLFGLRPSAVQSLGVTLLFLGLSLVRSWLLRRAFRRLAAAPVPPSWAENGPNGLKHGPKSRGNPGSGGK